MADGTRRDMGPAITKPASSTGNAGGTMDAWESGSAQDVASEAGNEHDKGLTHGDGRGEKPNY